MSQVAGHPHILPVLSLGRAILDTQQITGDQNNGKTLYTLRFPYISDSLQSRLNELSLEEGKEILRQQLSALSFIHERRITHRDIKPENVLLDGKLSYLSDFGSAREYGQNEEEVFQHDRQVDLINFVNIAMIVLSSDPNSTKQAADILSANNITAEAIQGMLN